MGEILDFNRRLERRSSQGVTWFVRTMARDRTRPRGTGERRKGGQAQSTDKIMEKRERETGVGRNKTDVILKQRALKHHPIDGQVPGTAFNIG